MSAPADLSIFVRSGKLPMRPLETARLLLRPLNANDGSQISEWQENFQSEAQSFLTFCLESYDRWGIGPWGIVVRETGILAGHCGFAQIQFIGNSAEVNYYVRSSHRKQGIATEALRVVLAYGFIDLHLSHIQARCGVDNAASERAMQNARLKFACMLAADLPGDSAGAQKLYMIRRDEFFTSESGA